MVLRHVQAYAMIGIRNIDPEYRRASASSTCNGRERQWMPTISGTYHERVEGENASSERRASERAVTTKATEELSGCEETREGKSELFL